jgi:uncharacterized membrane protein/protein-disulfide isomerase
MPLSTNPETGAPREADPIPRPKLWSWIALMLALVAAAICLYLAFVSIALGGRVAGCGDGAGGDCSAVLASRWARWFDLPVAVPAAVVYGLIFAAVTAAIRGDGRWRRRAWYVLVPLATLILAAASWFSALQLLALGRVCWYCLTVHGCAIVLAMLLFWKIPHDWRSPAQRAAQPLGLPPMTTVGLMLVGLVGLGVLVVGQLVSKTPAREIEITAVDPTSHSDNADPAGVASGGKSGATKSETFPIELSDSFPAVPGRSRNVVLLGGKVLLNVRRTPVLGRFDSDVIVVELFDYTCPHCRKLHHYLNEARDRYGIQLGVAVLVTPMDPACNRYVHDPPLGAARSACELARLSLAVWHTKPEAFAEFHEWMMGSSEIPTIEAARDRANEILGADGLELALADEAVERELQADNRLYELAGAGTIPKLLSEGSIISGEPASAQQLFEVLEKQLGLVP